MATLGVYDQSHVTLRQAIPGVYSDAHDALEANQLITTPGQIQQQFWGAVEEGVYTFKSYIIRRFSVRFDTNSLPVGANIISAKIEIKLSSKDTAISNTWSIVVQNGQPTYPHHTVEVGDYYYGHYSGNGGSIHCDNLHTSGEIDDIVLNATGISWINAGDYTKLILRLDHDIDSIDPAPDPPESTSGEWISEGVELQIGYTRLWIVYEAAEVTTDSVSYPSPIPNHSYEFAEATGTIVSGENITERGFEIKHEFSGDLYSSIKHSIAGFVGVASWDWEAWAYVGTLIKTESEKYGLSGYLPIGIYTLELGTFPAFFADQLFAGESYTYRAYMISNEETYYGEWLPFTLPDFPPGIGSDDQIPITDIIPTEPPVEPIVWESPVTPIEPVEPIEPFIPPEIIWPDFTYPDIPPYNGSWLGWFYYRKAYTKKDLDDLRRKCRMFQDNSVEYALIINHNSRVLQQFLNSMTDYMGADEHNTFKPIIPTQHLNALARRPLDVLDFKKMINNFISNSVDNANNVNNNFRLIRDGLGDYAYTEDEGFRDISITTKIVSDNNPDADRLKKVVDRLSKEMANNYAIINHNLHVVRSILI